MPDPTAPDPAPGTYAPSPDPRKERDTPAMTDDRHPTIARCRVCGGIGSHVRSCPEVTGQWGVPTPSITVPARHGEQDPPPRPKCLPGVAPGDLVDVHTDRDEYPDLTVLAVTPTHLIAAGGRHPRAGTAKQLVLNAAHIVAVWVTRRADGLTPADAWPRPTNRARAAFPTLTIPDEPPLTPFPYMLTRTDPDTGNRAAYPLTGTGLDPEWSRR